MANNRRKATSEDLKNEVLAKISQYKENSFPEAERIHEIIMRANPDLHPRLWYGMPGYARSKDSAVLCFFRKDDLISFGITEAANMQALAGSNAPIIPSAWYITNLDSSVEDKITKIVTKATAA